MMRLDTPQRDHKIELGCFRDNPWIPYLPDAIALKQAT